jgi:hypothetical protein
MTKIGDGNEIPEQSSVEKAHQDIELNTSKFLNALESYQDADPSDRSKLKPIMDQALGIIRNSVSKIKQAGIYNQEVKLEKDYEAYLNNSTPDNLSKIEKDLGTLKEFNNLK